MTNVSQLTPATREGLPAFGRIARELKQVPWIDIPAGATQGWGAEF